MTRSVAEQCVGYPCWLGYGISRWLVVLQAVRPKPAIPARRPQPELLVWKRIQRTGEWTPKSEAWLSQVEPAELTPEVLAALRARPAFVALAPDVDAATKRGAA